MQEAPYDIIIVGSGIVGAVCALALAKQTTLKIAVLDANPPAVRWCPHQYAERVSAISPASRDILQYVGAWESIQSKRISPYTDMHVWDLRGDGHIHFDSQSQGRPELGFIIEDIAIRESLLDQFKQYDHLDYRCPIKLFEWQQGPLHTVLMTDQGTLKTTLLIGADGASSWVREQAGIACTVKVYAHTAFIARATTELSHQMTAWQRFLPTGPLAFLPLQSLHECSIVWSATPALAAELMSLDEAAFRKKLAGSFEHRLGEIKAIGPRQHFNLTMRHAERYVIEKIALIGDAAHTIHPLAGQGVNLGLYDASCLAAVITQAVQKNRHFEALHTLRRYERFRKSDTFAMLTLVDLLKQLFETEQRPVPTIRNLGLKLTDRSPLLKNYLSRYAAGARINLSLLSS